MAALTKYRKLTAIAPGLTVRAVQTRWTSYAPPTETVELRGNVQTLDRRAAAKLAKWMGGWTDAQLLDEAAWMEKHNDD